MPVPVFIICSESGSIDRHTNELSIFNVCEQLVFQRIELTNDPRPETVPPDGRERRLVANSIRMTAYWRRSEDDTGRECEFRTTIQMPGMSAPIVAGEGRFVFKSYFHRLIATINTDLPPESGQIVVSNSVRWAEDGQWIEQRYVIPVERLEVSANQPQLPLS